MSKSKKIWLGVLTFLPVIFMFLYFLSFIFFFLGIAEFERSETMDSFPTFIFGGFGVMFLSIFLAIICGIGIMIYYIIHVTKNKESSENYKLLWILILVFAGGIGNIVYYFVEILPNKETNLPLHE